MGRGGVVAFALCRLVIERGDGVCVSRLLSPSFQLSDQSTKHITIIRSHPITTPPSTSLLKKSILFFSIDQARKTRKKTPTPPPPCLSSMSRSRAEKAPRLNFLLLSLCYLEVSVRIRRLWREESTKTLAFSIPPKRFSTSGLSLLENWIRSAIPRQRDLCVGSIAASWHAGSGRRFP